jgi:hypothetical protein
MVRSVIRIAGEILTNAAASRNPVACSGNAKDANSNFKGDTKRQNCRIIEPAVSKRSPAISKKSRTPIRVAIIVIYAVFTPVHFFFRRR